MEICQFLHIKTNEILYKLATLFKNDFENNSNLIARMNGSEFVILIPNIDETSIKNLIENFLSKVYKLEDLKEKINLGVCKYDNEESLKNLLIKMDYVISQAKLHTKKKFYFLENIEKYKSKEEWITIINDSLKNDLFILLYKEIIDINSNKILLKTVDFELNYKEDNFSNKGFIASLLELNKLNEVYFHIINKILDNKESQEKLSIQLPHFLVEDLNNYSNFQAILENNKNKNHLIFEIEEEAFNQNFSNTLMYIKLLKEYGFEFAIYNFIANSDDYSYLKELKPSYIKISDYFLLESKQSLNMLKILTQSLDIKLVMITTEKNINIEQLKDQGINAISNK